MQVIPENEEDIATIIAAEFRSFGGHRDPGGHPIAIALMGRPPQFAAGVEILDVVKRVLELGAQIKRKE